jgi:hypothetical protein
VELTYINSSGESITLKQSRPYFLTKIDGTGNIRQTVNTFKAPDQDGAFYMCARHARDLDGESPLRGLIAPTVSQRQGCPS